MKNSMLAIAVALTLASCNSEMAVAQAPSQTGAFGNRALGQSLTPAHSGFSAGIQTNPAGVFLSIGRSNGATSFTPWRQPYERLVDQTIATWPGAQPAVQLTVPSQTPGPAVQVGPPAQTAVPAVQVGPPVQTPGPVSEQSVGMTPGAAAAPTWNFALARGGNEAALASTARAEPYTRSPGLSDRLTRIARNKGMLVGRAIDVYVSGNAALVQGVVRTRADRALLGNVVGLEPDVSRIDNRLAIAGSGGLSSNAPAGR